jgi:hypothetical protein
MAAEPEILLHDSGSFVVILDDGPAIFSLNASDGDLDVALTIVLVDGIQPGMFEMPDGINARLVAISDGWVCDDDVAVEGHMQIPDGGLEDVLVFGLVFEAEECRVEIIGGEITNSW